VLAVLLSAALIGSHAQTFDAWPTWSPNGKLIAFVRTVGTRSDLEVVRADGTHLRRLSSKAAKWASSWSPNSRRLVFARVQHGGRDNTIWRVGVNGTALRKVATGYDPMWSPDGSTIAYGHLGRIETVKPDGSSRRDLTKGAGPLAWSPDGTRIAFSTWSQGLPRLHVLALRTRISDELANGYWPTWSPDGTKIGFSNGCFAVVIAADASSSAPACIAAPVGSQPPRWSPDSASYVYCFDRGLRGRVLTPGPSTLLMAVTPGCEPDWSPDGTTIAFDRPGEGTDGSRIYLMNPDGTNVRPLLRGS